MTCELTSASRLCCLVLLALFALSVQAQSGRRQSKAPAAVPVPAPTSEPSPSAKEEKQADVEFIVGTDERGAFNYLPLRFYDAVLRGCGDRLRKASSAKVDIAQENMTRGEALKKAKTEKTAYVVWLQLVPDVMGSATNQNYDQLVLEYIVYAPVTAKTLTSGRAYPNSSQKGPLIIPTPGSNKNIYPEQVLKRAGEDVADRILNALHMVIPSTVPNISTYLAPLPDISVQ